VAERLGLMTNNQAEYTAWSGPWNMPWNWDRHTTAGSQRQRTDGQADEGEYRVKNEELRELYDEARGLVRQFQGTVTFQHVRRGKIASRMLFAMRFWTQTTQQPQQEESGGSAAGSTRSGRSGQAGCATWPWPACGCGTRLERRQPLAPDEVWMTWCASWSCMGQGAVKTTCCP